VSALSHTTPRALLRAIVLQHFADPLNSGIHVGEKRLERHPLSFDRGPQVLLQYQALAREPLTLCGPRSRVAVDLADLGHAVVTAQDHGDLVEVEPEEVLLMRTTRSRSFSE